MNSYSYKREGLGSGAQFAPNYLTLGESLYPLDLSLLIYKIKAEIEDPASCFFSVLWMRKTVMHVGIYSYLTLALMYVSPT